MIRHIALLTWTAILSASIVACEKPGATERQKEEQANEQAAEARNEAAQKAQNAQATAEKDIAKARVDFEKTREDYRHSRANDLSDLDKKIAELEANAKTATGKTKVDLQARLPQVHAARDAFGRDLQALDATTPTLWDQAKANVDREWELLKTSVDKAR
ncbi:MAG: hypothetical protein M3O46_03535 [Myxococcota bacterium]|nr:hypothetical protein [Myxococcota bacterium]